MKLIDGDKLCDMLRSETTPMTEYGKGIHDGFAFAIAQIETMPEIEEEPVRHGRWENQTESKPRMFERNGHTFTERQCSECGRWNISVTGSITCKYCPQCGAKMDGGAKNGFD